MSEHPSVQFELGSLCCTIVSDGRLELGPLRDSLADPVARLPAGFDGAVRAVLEVNLLLVEGTGRRVLIDAGAGSAPDFGRKLFGETAGKAVEALREAGFEREEIDAIALTHAHADHAWGLVDDDGRPCFPRAELLIGEVELAHWMRERPHPGEVEGKGRLIREGARRSILAYGDRIRTIRAGDRIEPGIVVRETFGHSPGHVVLEVTSEGRTLVCWGDVCHHPVLLAKPDLSFIFDWRREEATSTRLRLFAELAERQVDILAAHFEFPGVGRLSSLATGGFGWIPRSL